MPGRQCNIKATRDYQRHKTAKGDEKVQHCAIQGYILEAECHYSLDDPSQLSRNGDIVLHRERSRIYLWAQRSMGVTMCHPPEKSSSKDRNSDKASGCSSLDGLISLRGFLSCPSVQPLQWTLSPQISSLESPDRRSNEFPSLSTFGIALGYRNRGLSRSGGIESAAKAIRKGQQRPLSSRRSFSPYSVSCGCLARSSQSLPSKRHNVSNFI